MSSAGARGARAVAAVSASEAIFCAKKGLDVLDALLPGVWVYRVCKKLHGTAGTEKLETWYLITFMFSKALFQPQFTSIF